MITRLRLDVALYEPAPPHMPGTTGRPRKAGRCLATLAKVAAGAATVGKVRAHLGVKTQHQWSDRAIARTTPCFLALFSIVTLLAGRLPARQRRSTMMAAWYPKLRPTFSDALAGVRRAIWREQHFQTSPRQADRRKIPFRLPQAWAFALFNVA